MTRYCEYPLRRGRIVTPPRAVEVGLSRRRRAWCEVEISTDLGSFDPAGLVPAGLGSVVFGVRENAGCTRPSVVGDAVAVCVGGRSSATRFDGPGIAHRHGGYVCRSR